MIFFNYFAYEFANYFACDFNDKKVFLNDGQNEPYKGARDINPPDCITLDN